MDTFSSAPHHMFVSLWRNRDLVLTLIRREVIGRYKGSVIGIFWSFLNPIFMLAIYTFVFSVVFQARWAESNGSKAEFALVLFVGLLLFNLFSECLNRAPMLLIANANFVKKVKFPLEVLPWVAFGSAFFHLCVSLIVWLLFYGAIFGMPHITVLLFPLLLIPATLLIMGISWLLTGLGTFVRDISQLTTMLTSVLLFLSPIFYPVSALPEAFRPFLYANPLTVMIEAARQLLMWGTLPDMTMLGVFSLISFLAAWFGFACFQRVRGDFADVL